MPASANIPAIAQAYVSERAKKTLDLVGIPFTFTSFLFNKSNRKQD